MRIDITNLLSENEASMDLDFKVLPGDFATISDEFKFDEPVEFNGMLTNIDGVLRLEGKLEAAYYAICARCTEPTVGRLNITVDEEIFDENDGAEEEAYTHNGKYLDIDKILKDNIILKLPMVQLCSSTCKGLCPLCGCDLNEEQCSCSQDDINPQFEVLGNLFKDDDKEN